MLETFHHHWRQHVHHRVQDKVVGQMVVFHRFQFHLHSASDTVRVYLCNNIQHSNHERTENEIKIKKKEEETQMTNTVTIIV